MQKIDFNLIDWNVIEVDGGIIPPQIVADAFGFCFYDEENYTESFVESFGPFKRIKKGQPHNATTRGVFFGEDCLLFTSKDSYENWQHYAGLEYEDDALIFQHGGNYFAYFAHWCSERVEEIIKRLNDEN